MTGAVSLATAEVPDLRFGFVALAEPAPGEGGDRLDGSVRTVRAPSEIV
jgi:hypothetical protein